MSTHQNELEDTRRRVEALLAQGDVSSARDLALTLHASDLADLVEALDEVGEQAAGRTGAHGGWRVLVAVHTLAGQRDEEIATLHRARVDGRAGEPRAVGRATCA